MREGRISVSKVVVENGYKASLKLVYKDQRMLG